MAGSPKYATRRTGLAQIKTRSPKQSARSEPSAAAEQKPTQSGASLRRLRSTYRSEIKTAGITKAAIKKTASSPKMLSSPKAAIKKTASSPKMTSTMKKAASIRKSAIKKTAKTSRSVAIPKKRVSFHKRYVRTYQSCEESEEQREKVSAKARAEQSTVARKPEKSSNRLRERFMNLRNVNGKPPFRQNKATKSAANKSSDKSGDKSSAAPQPASRSTRSHSSVQSSAGTSNGPSAGSDALLDNAKPIVIKLVRLLNCPICGGALNTTKHTCGR